eukprot:3842414-Amphidinium_carterae.1
MPRLDEDLTVERLTALAKISANQGILYVDFPTWGHLVTESRRRPSCMAGVFKRRLHHAGRVVGPEDGFRWGRVPRSVPH